MGPENDSPENDAGPDVEPSHPYEFNIRVTQSDPELQVIEAMFTLLQLLPHQDTRGRVLRYVSSRMAPVPDAEITPLDQVDRDHVARILALADNRSWAYLSPVQQSSYYRRADALLSDGLAVIRVQG